MKHFLLLIIIFTSGLFAQGWEVVSEMPEPVYGGRALVKDSLIYILGGYSYSQNSPVDLIQEFNPATGEWKVAGNMNAKRYGFVAGMYGDSVVIVGGVYDGIDSSYIESMEIWNFQSAPYIYSNHQNFMRAFSTGVITNGKLYLFGGLTDTSLYLQYFSIYDISSQTVTLRDNASFEAIFPVKQTAELLENNIYIFGGVLIGVSGEIYKYNIDDNSLESLPVELLHPRAGCDVSEGINGEIYIIGGFSETKGALASVEVFHEAGNDYWLQEGFPLNFPRSELMVVTFGDSIYVFGGINAEGNPVPEVEKLYISYSTSYAEQSVQTGSFGLSYNYPNPFNPSTKIKYSLPRDNYVSINVYDVLGNEITTLVNDEKPAGTYEVVFDAAKISHALPGGIYFYRLRAGGYTETKKLVYLK